MGNILFPKDELCAGEQRKFIQLEKVPFSWTEGYCYRDLQKGDLQKGDLQNGDLMKGDLQNGDLQKGDLQNGDLQKGDLQNGDLQKGDLQNGDLQKGDLQNGDQYGARQQQGPTAVFDDWYGAPNIENPMSVLNAEYWPHNPGPSTITPIPSVALQWADVISLAYDGIPVYSPGTNTAPTCGEKNGNDFVLPVQTAPPVKAPVSLKVKKPQEKKVAEGPYVKKPLNAFMLFLKQHRKSAEEELGVRTSAAVNKLLGQRWKSLSAVEKASFTTGAKLESSLHATENPEWSHKNNYGKKRKRYRPKA